jgi:tetratricopeptide (TPR) repeat protein
MAENNDNHVVDGLMSIWLDSKIETHRQNRDTKTLIRQIVKGRLQTFTEPDPCIDYISELTSQKVLLIISNTFGQHVVPLILEMPQIQTIYIYCSSRQNAEAWSKEYLKVSGIFTDKKVILSKICDDVRSSDQDSQLPMSVFHMDDRQNSLQNLTKESATFMWYRLVINLIRLMAEHGDSKAEMIAESRARYHDNESVKKKINEFEKEYEPENAFWWYTNDTFVYRLLNEALRTQNTEIIFKFRFFINDLHNQIEQHYQQDIIDHPSKVDNHLLIYRGQRMNKEEIDLLQRNVNECISMNSFLSATTVREVAEMFADTSDQCNAESPLQSVLFTIEIYDINKETTPFASIGKYSCCADEEEVLLTIGAIFKVKSVQQEGKTWHVHLQLSKEQNELCKDLSDYMTKEIKLKPGPLSLGWFLYRMSEFDKAKRYAELMITQFSADDKQTGHAYNLLGLIYKDTNKLQKSIECYEKALDVYSRSNHPGSPQVITTHCSLGLAHLAAGDNRNADEQRQQAEEKLFNSSHTDNSLLVSMINSLKAKIKTVHGDYEGACENFNVALEEKKKKLPTEHPSIATTLNERGFVKEKMRNYEEALKDYKHGLEICSKTLTLNHFDLVNCHANIGRIYFKRGDYAPALKEFELAFNIATESTRDETDIILTLKQSIEETKEKLKRKY